MSHRGSAPQSAARAGSTEAGLSVGINSQSQAVCYSADAQSYEHTGVLRQGSQASPIEPGRMVGAVHNSAAAESAQQWGISKAGDSIRIQCGSEWQGSETSQSNMTQGLQGDRATEAQQSSNLRAQSRASRPGSKDVYMQQDMAETSSNGVPEEAFSDADERAIATMLQHARRSCALSVDQEERQSVAPSHTLQRQHLSAQFDHGQPHRGSSVSSTALSSPAGPSQYPWLQRSEPTSSLPHHQRDSKDATSAALLQGSPSQQGSDKAEQQTVASPEAPALPVHPAEQEHHTASLLEHVELDNRPDEDTWSRSASSVGHSERSQLRTFAAPASGKEPTQEPEWLNDAIRQGEGGDEASLDRESEGASSSGEGARPLAGASSNASENGRSQHEEDELSRRMRRFLARLADARSAGAAGADRDSAGLTSALSMQAAHGSEDAFAEEDKADLLQVLADPTSPDRQRHSWLRQHCTVESCIFKYLLLLL